MDCDAQPDGEHSCGHEHDIGVECSGILKWLKMHACHLVLSYTPDTCVDGNVRLIGGLVPTEGTVQMCVGGRWRELCYSDWGYQEAFVVCRQLGLPVSGKCV